MTAFPTVKRRDVTTAPIRTSLHKILVSGINLKMSANSIVITTKEKTECSDSKRMVETRTQLLTNPAAADKTAVTTKEVSNKNPVATTRPSEKNRCLTVTIQKPFALLSTFQIVLSAS